jgi:polyisoprenyl-phosphate glycosyltransferase
MSDTISVVIPLFRSSAHARELLERIRLVVPGVADDWELVLVDDHCPHDSGLAAAGLLHPGDPVRISRLDRNVGQLAAVNLGLAATTGEVVVVMDGDLQDRPEDIPILVEALRNGDSDVVAAGRSGRYTSPGRDRTARWFRWTRSALTLGRVPADAGLFLAARRSAIDRVLALGDPMIHPISGLARVHARITSIPIERSARSEGTSGYSWRRRLGVATSALAAATPLFPLVRTVDRHRWTPPGQHWLTNEANT